MLDSSIQHLLEHVVDSPAKLQLCLLFYENRRLEGTASQLANRIYRDIWCTREALRELAEDGLLCESAVNGEQIYRYGPRAEYTDAIFRLVQGYNEPFERDRIQRALHDIDGVARFRRTQARSSAFELQML